MLGYHLRGQVLVLPPEQDDAVRLCLVWLEGIHTCATDVPGGRRVLQNQLRNLRRLEADEGHCLRPVLPDSRDGPARAVSVPRPWGHDLGGLLLLLHLHAQERGQVHFEVLGDLALGQRAPVPEDHDALGVVLVPHEGVHADLPDGRWRHRVLQRHLRNFLGLEGHEGYRLGGVLLDLGDERARPVPADLHRRCLRCTWLGLHHKV
mmetsp:Transcript_65061/g.209636  ORF Transcript_65061/g.209636 Transcript_65061/m.209636 type:complete len:206 (-) Transcript_65061:647-1264(-)